MDILTDLVKMAQDILDGGFDVDSFLSWKNLAFFSLTRLLGPLHHYTCSFLQFTRDCTPKSLLAGGGILEAVKATVSEKRIRPECNGRLESTDISHAPRSLVTRKNT